MAIDKEQKVEWRELAEIAARKLDQITNQNLLCHSISSWLLPDIAREGIISERFAKRIHKEAYRSIYHSSQNQEYVSVTNARDKIFAVGGNILLFIKTAKSILDVKDTEYTLMCDGEFLIKRRVSPREFVGVCWYGSYHEGFRRTFDQVVQEIWTKKPELAVPIYQCDSSSSNPSNLNICSGLPWFQNMKLLWPTEKYPEWLNFYDTD